MVKKTGWFVCMISVVLGSQCTLNAQTNGVTLVANFFNPHGQSNDNPPVRFNGCWGYVAPDGREYAILGTYTGTAIIDITDSANIREIVHIPGPPSIWREMRTWGSYAYVVSEGGGGTQIINLSQLPDTAMLVTSFIYTSGSSNTARAHTIGIFEGFMYLNGPANWGSTGQRGIVIFNLNNPTAPQFEGAYTQRYIHDSYMRNDTIYAAAIYSGGGIDIIDARVRSNPSLIARITYSGSGTHNTWLTKDGRYVISTDEIGTTQKNLKFWSLATLPTPPTTPSAQYTFSPADVVHNVTVRGDYAYVAWYTAGFVVVNISNPLNPQTAGWYDTYSGPSGSYNGVWGVYPFFPSGKIIASDMQTGLYVFRFAHLLPRKSVQLLSPIDIDTVRTSGPLQFRWSSAANRQQDPHFHELLVAGPNIDTRTRVDDTTFTLAALVGYVAGSTYSWRVLTRDEATSVPSADTFRFVYLPPPATPLPICPPNHASHQPLSPLLCWQPVPGSFYYHVQASLDSMFSTIVVDSSILASEIRIGPLLANTDYYWRVRAANSSGVSGFSDTWKFRTAGPLAAPALVAPAHGTVGVAEKVTLVWHPSPSALEYHLQLATDSLFQDLIINDSSVVDTTYLLQGLFNMTDHFWRVGARASGVGSPWSEMWRFTTLFNESVAHTVISGWNMISLPFRVSDPRSVVVYPTASSSAFTFVTGQGYAARDTIETGRGYWLKFDSAQTVMIEGLPRFRDSIDVVQGWNMIGTISYDVAVVDVIEIPPGIVVSSYFAKDIGGGYAASDTLRSMNAYWVKIGQSGKLVISRPFAGRNWVE